MKLINLHNLNTDETESLPRTHLGLSGIGNPCHRKLQYEHYWAYKSKHSERIIRLFSIGHASEDMIVLDLDKHEVRIIERQKEIVATEGHWKGHIDGIGYCKYNILIGDNGIYAETEFLFEAKTHNDKSFKELKKDGVRKSKPFHYGQVQSYMGYLNLKQTLYCAYNKNDSEYYFEIIDFDEETFSDNVRKEQEVVYSDVMLKRIGNNNQTWFECKFCEAKNVCFFKEPVHKSCRTCIHVDVLPNGEWGCGMEGSERVLTTADQLIACDSYKVHFKFEV